MEIIICLTIITVVCIICYTCYKCQTSTTYDKVMSELKWYAERVQDNNLQFENYWQQIIQLRAELKQLLDLEQSK